MTEGKGAQLAVLCRAMITRIKIDWENIHCAGKFLALRPVDRLALEQSRGSRLPYTMINKGHYYTILFLILYQSRSDTRASATVEVPTGWYPNVCSFLHY